MKMTPFCVLGLKTFNLSQKYKKSGAKSRFDVKNSEIHINKFFLF